LPFTRPWLVVMGLVRYRRRFLDFRFFLDRPSPARELE
jgi:hypothetical protein